jgi:hypothetical protein
VERDGRPCVEFSWEGNDECDPASGRGWAVLEEDGSLRGRIFFHLGDDSGFTAVREGRPRPYGNGRRPHRSLQLQPPRPDHPVADLPRNGSSAGPSLAALSNTSGPHRSQGQDWWPSSGAPQGGPCSRPAWRGARQYGRPPGARPWHSRRLLCQAPHRTRRRPERRMRVLRPAPTMGTLPCLNGRAGFRPAARSSACVRRPRDRPSPAEPEPRRL